MSGAQLTGLLELFDSQRARIRELVQASADQLSVVAAAPAHPIVDALIAQSTTAPVLIITATGREAQDAAEALTSFIDPHTIAVFPSWETLPHERLSPSTDTVGQRMSILRRLAHPDEGSIRILIASVRAVMQPIPVGLGEIAPVRLQAGDHADLREVVAALVERGYERVDLVERRGQVAVRGGILDVFPPTAEHAVRVEFWGDEVEEIRDFAVTDQRSLELAPVGLWAPPVRELLLTDAVRQRARELVDQHPTLSELLEPISEGLSVEGMESLAPVLLGEMVPVLNSLPQGTQVLAHEPERIRARALDVVRTADEFLAAGWHAAAVGADVPVDLAPAPYLSVDELRDVARNRKCNWWNISALTLEDPDLECAVFPADEFRGDASAAIEFMRGELGRSQRVVILGEGHGPLDRLVEEFGAMDLPVRQVTELTHAPERGIITLALAPWEHGFTYESLSLFTVADILGHRDAARAGARMPSRRKRTIDPLTLTPGDYVVHEQHGVGRYVEMVRRTVGGAERDYLVLEYAASKRGQPADRLFVPMDQLDQVTRYVGGEAPSVHRLGGADWTKAKGRARKAVKQIAGELVRLYAARQSAKGHAFGLDTPWQHELENAFPYVETPDQVASIDEVKRDMERTVPMDRLICGDVGYGKTEIAVRAAFKAVQDGKQVAVLVPTTLLVQQHLATFDERFASFPIKVAGLSRFNTATETEAVLDGITGGIVDVVIGTHRLLTPSVRFKDLGLVIIDEEQRFGVEHKEHLKALRTNVDVLAMSATPIPRTLEMAVTGIREMSVIQTPPEERHPVLTYVGPYDEKQIAAAIRRELLRDGQVFFVHNRVESIERAATRVREAVPEAVVAVAHGQMSEAALEQVIVDFWEKRVDVLVCTTIVESGIDVANANTLIVDRADTLGLSQLHQLRGRVGRGRERAYAYLLYDPNRPLSETAHERLATIAQRTDLGSGMQIALKDLEIRGAGNLLGGEQSGHIADVGFDLYIRMVGEALAEYRGEAGETAEVKVELPITAHIPEQYVPQERLRLEAYKRLADAVTDEQVDDVGAELLDRYGPLPEPVAALIAVAHFRVHCRAAGISEVVAQGAGVRLHPVELPESAQMRLTRLYPRTLIKPAVRTIIVPKPTPAALGGSAITDLALLAWAEELISRVQAPITAAS